MSEASSSSVGVSLMIAVVAMGMVFAEAHNPNIWTDSYNRVKEHYNQVKNRFCPPSKEEKKKNEERVPQINFDKSGFIFFHVETSQILLEIETDGLFLTVETPYGLPNPFKAMIKERFGFDHTKLAENEYNKKDHLLCTFDRENNELWLHFIVLLQGTTDEVLKITKETRQRGYFYSFFYDEEKDILTIGDGVWFLGRQKEVLLEHQHNKYISKCIQKL